MELNFHQGKNMAIGLRAAKKTQQLHSYAFGLKRAYSRGKRERRGSGCLSLKMSKMNRDKKKEEE